MTVERSIAHPLAQITCGLVCIAAMYGSGKKIGKNYSTFGAYSLALGAVIDAVVRIYSACMRKNHKQEDYASFVMFDNPQKDVKQLCLKDAESPYYSVHEGFGVSAFFEETVDPEEEQLNEAYLKARMNTEKNISAAQPIESEKINSSLKKQAKKSVNFAEVISTTREFTAESLCYSKHEGFGVSTFFEEPPAPKDEQLNEASIKARINTGKNVSAAQPTESDKIKCE
jgi:hypothetical protein